MLIYSHVVSIAFSFAVPVYEMFLILPLPQITYVSKKHGFVTLYVTATDNSECTDWVATLRQGKPLN